MLWHRRRFLLYLFVFLREKLVELLDQLKEFALIFFFCDETAQFFNSRSKFVGHLAAPSNARVSKPSGRYSEPARQFDIEHGFR
ncbi:MAG: hypothetical protein JWO91_1225 [Acidobacteriaceae bacterium]|nr:hypothetical protein [Acidobacteriaceae bacterium]